MNKSEALRATRHGAIAASVSATLTLLLMLIAVIFDLGGKMALWNDPATIADVVLLFALAFGIYRKSRTAAVLTFVYFIVAKLIITLETGAYGGLVVAAIFLYFYGKAIQGTFTYHRLEKAENPDYKASTKWAYILGIPGTLIVLVLLAFALLSTTGVIPSTRVQSGDELLNSDLKTLVDHGIILPQDKVEYFFAQGLTSLLERGNILTQNRVILYYTDANQEIQVYEIPRAEIIDVILEEKGDTLNNSTYRVVTKDPDKWLKLELSIEQKGDLKFVQALKPKH